MTSTQLREPERDERYRRLADLLHEQFGMSIENFPQSLARMLLDRLPQTISDGDPAVLRRIVSACSIGETMFMRHAEHFAALRHIAPALPSARAGRKLAVWSAGCATGEEAYSLAAVLGSSLVNEVDVLGTDMNPDSIARAQRAQYGLWSLRGVDIAAHASWLHTEGLRVDVETRTRQLTRFAVLNLVKEPYPDGLDVIFCRNVLLYFSESAAQKVLERLAASLQPGGILFLGYTDAQPRISAGLVACAWQGVRYFQRPLSHPERGVPVREPEPPLPAPALAPEAGSSRLSFEAALGFAIGLAGQGQVDDALAAVRELCARFPLEVEPNVLGTLIAQEAGKLDVALDFARRAGFLTPHEPMPHYLLAACLEQAGEKRLAGQRFSMALMSLAGTDLGKAIAHGGGLTGFQLRRMIELGLEKTR